MREGFAVDLKGSDDAKCECVAHAHGSSTGEGQALTKPEYRQSLTAIAARGSLQEAPIQRQKTSARHPQGQWVEGPREPSVHRTAETGSRGPGKTPKTSCANTRFGCIGTRCRAFSFGWIIFFDRAESEHSCGLDSDRNASGFQRENLPRCAVGVLCASPGTIQRRRPADLNWRGSMRK